MRYNICLLLLLFFFFGRSQTQNDIPPIWGTWGLGYIKNNNSLNVYNNYNITGFHMYVSWDLLEPTKGNFKFDELDQQFDLLVKKNLFIGLQVLVGPNAPAWIYNDVPKVMTTGGNMSGPYPYYLDPQYKQRYYLLLKKVAEHIEGLSDEVKKKFVYWQISEGSTGDEDPYKGTPDNPKYEIDYYTWQDFKHAAWDSAESYRDNQALYRLQFNSGNFAQEIQYIDAHFPQDQHKNGMLSHWYSFDGELLYYVRQYRDLLTRPLSLRTRGEVQDNFNTTWWMEAPVKNSFTLACSALSGGLDMLDVAGGYISSVSNDTRPTDFFQKYAGLRFGAQSNIGFIALRDVPDLADTGRFPEATYGDVIAQSSRKAFNNRIDAIESNPKDSSMYKYWQKMKAVVKYLNPARVTKITGEFKAAGAEYNTDGDDYHNDFGVNMTKNYAMFIRQLDEDETSIGGWRVGKDSAIYGRYARLFKIKNGKAEMRFRFNENFAPAGSAIELTVTYFDKGTGKWSINGSNKKVAVTNTNTNEWIQKTIGVNNYVPNTVSEADFSLRYEDGDNTAFALIEVSVTK